MLINSLEIVGRREFDRGEIVEAARSSDSDHSFRLITIAVKARVERVVH